MCSHYSKYESVLGSLPVWVLSVMNTTSEGHYWRRASRIAGEKLGKSSSPKATIKLDKIVKKTTIPGISKLTEGKKQMSTYLKKKKKLLNLSKNKESLLCFCLKLFLASQL